MVKGEDPISVFCDKYSKIDAADTIESEFNTDECLEKMKIAAELADKGLNYKLYAGNCKIDVIILSLAKMRNSDEKIIKVCLECLIQLYTGECLDLLKIKQ